MRVRSSLCAAASAVVCLRGMWPLVSQDWVVRRLASAHRSFVAHANRAMPEPLQPCCLRRPGSPLVCRTPYTWLTLRRARRRCTRQHAHAAVISGVRITRGRDDTLTFSFLPEDSAPQHPEDSAPQPLAVDSGAGWEQVDLRDRADVHSIVINDHAEAQHGGLGSGPQRSGGEGAHAAHVAPAQSDAGRTATMERGGLNGAHASASGHEPHGPAAPAQNGAGHAVAASAGTPEAGGSNGMRTSANGHSSDNSHKALPRVPLLPARDGVDDQPRAPNGKHFALIGHAEALNGQAAPAPVLHSAGVRLNGQGATAAEAAALAHLRRQVQLSRDAAPVNDAGASASGRAARGAGHGLAAAAVAGAAAEAVTAAYSDLATAGHLEEALALVEAAVAAGRTDVLGRRASRPKGLGLGYEVCAWADAGARLRACPCWRAAGACRGQAGCRDRRARRREQGVGPSPMRTPRLTRARTARPLAGCCRSTS